ncbi:hypothetical protein EY693_15855 [Enterococcus casseliflavus]|uniref:class I adenylate-forming enzyme family protein n=1 Tax=Enterococcus casseliflavus TaxID=37734 RepID=UPI001AD6D3CE|nr:class I adenylate-forming enzyme family protein [Enterococcus casseliflavus]MBO6359620.1 hypothetical protein [Enterococcus casseliflavus]MBO6377748.1 hypothetical protein [Enterococcus casseliflavus]
MIISGYEIFKQQDPDLEMNIDETQNLLFSNQSYSNIFQIIQKTALKNPKQMAIITSNEKYNYLELILRIQSITQVLREKNVKNNQLVLLISESSINFCLMLLALNQIGAIAVIVSSKLTSVEMEQTVSGLDFSQCILSQGQLERYPLIESPLVIEEVVLEANSIESLDEQENIIQADSPLIQLFTSGTTSKKKRVELTHKQLLHACYSYQYVNQITADDKTIICNPIYHVTALIALFYTFLITGGTIYLHERFDVERIENELEENKISYLHLSPTAYKLFLNKKKAKIFPYVRLVASGSSYLPSEIIRGLNQAFVNANIVSVYGLTETSSPGTILHHVEKKENYQSVGYPFPGVFLKILSQDNRDLGENKIGDIYLKGTNVIKDYVTQSDESFYQGWLSTGDIGYIDQTNRLFIVDRAKDMINRGGEKIFTTEIEESLYEVSGIKNCVALGVPDELYGEIPVTVLSIDKNIPISLERIKAHLEQKLSRYKIPQKFYLMNHIPEIESGKFDKRKILKLILDGSVKEW